jgi:hypothetical protein
MGRPLGLSVLSVLLALLSVVFSYLGFFTSTWIQVFSDDEQTQISAENGNLEDKNTPLNQRERLSTTQSGKYGLFDHGVSDLNCDAIPFSICMYTRAGLFTAIILQIPSLVVAILSCAIMTSGGSLRTTGTLARAGGTFFLLSTCGGLMGMIVFTMQQVSCITNCPSEGFTYYPRMEDNRVQFAWSFYISWAGQILGFIEMMLLFLIAWITSRSVAVDERNQMNSHKAAMMANNHVQQGVAQLPPPQQVYN